MSVPERVVILVPRRSGVGDRDALWRFCKPWWQAQCPDWPIIEGDHDDGGPFNRSKALNAAAAKAGAWDVAIILDSDVLVGREQVDKAIAGALEVGAPMLAYSENVRLNMSATRRIVNGWRGNWRGPNCVTHVYTDMCSACVVVTRAAWDAARGFDEGFVGWGYEDNAFMAAVETMTNTKMVTVPGECWHLNHRTQPRKVELLHANRRRLALYGAASGDPVAMRALLDGRTQSTPQYEAPESLIPARLHRTVPQATSPVVEWWWRAACALHPGWECSTHRDPLNPSHFPFTAPLWDRCATGAQRAGLIRLEVLVTWGGVYIDSDVELFKPLDVLRHVPAFAAWEDANVVPDAVLGCAPNHPAFVAALEAAIEAVERGDDTWKSGPGVTTKLLPKRDDVLVLPPGSFYPVHYREKARLRAYARHPEPWAFGLHHWAHSWA